MTDRFVRWFDLVLSADIGAARNRHDNSGFGWLLVALAIALSLRVAIAAFLPSIYVADEKFQYWEQGFRLVFGYGIVPWEYEVGLRSWIVPGAIGAVIWFVDLLGGGPEVWKLAVQTLLSLVSLSIVATSFFWARRLAGTSAAVLAALVAATWFEFLFFSARPLTEVPAAATLFPSAYILCAIPAPSRRMLVLGGVLLGLSLVLRLHLAPAVLVIAVASLRHLDRQYWLPPAIAAALVVLFSGLLDWATWGFPFHTLWQNFAINVIEDKASQYGTRPIYWYLLFYANAWPGLVAVMFGLLAVGSRRAPLMLVVPLVIVLSHSLIGHKEYRFVYPALPFLMALASIGSAELLSRVTRKLSTKTRHWSLVALALGWLITSASLAAHDGYRPKFTKRTDQIRLFSVAGAVPEACGMAITGLPWSSTPGYSGLVRDIPLYFLSRDEVSTLVPAFNLYMYRRWPSDRHWDEPVLPTGFEELTCSDVFCLARRAGACQEQPDRTIIETMRRE